MPEFRDDPRDLAVPAREKVQRARQAGAGRRQKAGLRFNQQIVGSRPGVKRAPLGYLRLTLDTHTLATGRNRWIIPPNILRLMLYCCRWPSAWC